MINIKLKREHKDAVVPKLATEGSAGFDLVLVEDEMVLVGHTTRCKTGISIELPKGYEGQVRSRSGLAADGIVVANSPGTIDWDYRGELIVLIHNQGQFDKVLRKGDRIAQLVIQKIPEIFIEVVNNLTLTQRGEQGFGSTGV